MISEEKMRREFEAFYMSQDQNAKEHIEFIREDGEYGYHVTRCAWNTWKASRESLVESGNNKMYTESPEGGQP